MESKGTTVVASCIHQALTDSHRYTTLTDATDHGRLKRILGPKGAFKNRTSAYRTLKGMEAMHSLRKGQGTMFAYGHPNPDAVIVSRVFETA